MQPKGVNRLRAFGKYSPRRECAYLYRRGAVNNISKSELAIGDIFPPRPECAVGLDGERVSFPTDNARPGSKCSYLHRRGTSVPSAIAQAESATRISPPRPQRAVGLDGEGVHFPSCNTRPSRKRTNLYRRGAIDDIGLTDLTKIIFAPRPQRTVGFGGKSLHTAVGYSRPHSERAHLRGGTTYKIPTQAK